MGFGADQLRDKALLALEEAVVEARYRRARRSYALRFALAYLWAYSGARDRRPFDALWRALRQEKTPWSFGVADGCLLAIYRTLGLSREGEAAMRLWQKRDEEERG
ncbi:MAG TPA: hypothetical protein VF704_08760 [Allosphingosinicella sp.]|jgi:hypothetical protein